MERRSWTTAVRHGLVAGLVAFAVFGASAAVFGANPHEDRPFQGTLAGTSTVTGPAPGGFASVSTGTISATHLGKGSYTLASTQDYGRHTEAEHPAGDCAFVDGTVTYTAANGDQIQGDLDADRSVICVSEEFPGPGTDTAYLSTLYIEVTGGTGRFADATGWVFSRGSSRTDTPPAGTTFTDTGIVLGDIDY